MIAGYTGTSFTHTGLSGGTTYYYKVAANNAAGTSALSVEDSATTAVVLQAPDQPTGLNAVGGTPDEIRAFFKEETERWRKVIVTGGIKPP